MESDNRRSIQIVLEMLNSKDRFERGFAAKTLGDIGRSKGGELRQTVKDRLALVAKSDDENTETRRLAKQSIRQLNGEFDTTWEKYNPQYPEGSPSDLYYLIRG